MTFKEVLEIYKSHDILVGKRIIIMPKKMENPEREEAEAIGFSEDGTLQVKLASGKEQELLSEEVSIRPTSNK